MNRAVHVLRRGTLIFTALFQGDRGMSCRVALSGTMLLFGVPNSKSASLHFAGAPALYNSGHEIRDVAVGDFDGDGRQDAVAAVESGIVFFRGNGDGTLAVPVEIPSTPQDRLLAVDLDADGHTDLIAWSRSSNVIRLFRGSSSGLAADTSYDLRSAVSDVKVGDLNADAALDIVASTGPQVQVLFGARGGRFSIPQYAVSRAAIGSLALEDLNGDGRLDLACYGKPYANGRGGTWITVALGFGNGGFNTPRQYNGSWVPGPLVTADVTADGKMDLAYAGVEGGGIDALNVLAVQPGHGNGTFGPAVTTVIPGSVSRMMAVDLDHDGRTDLLLASGPQVMSLMGNGGGSFTRGETAVMAWPVAGFALVDLDGDGSQDLVAGTKAGFGRDDLVVLKGFLNRAPVARCRDVVVKSGPGCVADANIDDGSSDPDGNPITVVQSPAGPYRLGVTPVTLTCTDSNGASASCGASVTVVDATPPSLDLAVDRTILWPPNHKLVPVHVTATSRDDCDERPSITLASIVSSDPDPSHEDIQGAAIGTADFDFELRAESEGKESARTYTICYDSRDDAGNDTRQCVMVHVQHDLRARADGTQVFLEAPGQASTFDAGLAASPGRGLIGLRYSIPHDGYVRVSIYDVAGHRVARPVDGPQAAGWHQASFSGGNASQLLFYRVEWDGRSLSGSIPFLR
jgi:hypothetical protein